MDARRTYYVLLASIFLLAVAIIGGTIKLNNLMTAKADQLTQLKAKDAALERERVTFEKTSKELNAYSELYKISQSVVPEDKSQAQAVREIVNIANQYGVSLSAITFPSSSLGSGSASATTKNSKSLQDVNTKTNKLSQLTAVKNIPGIYQLPITVQSDESNPVRYDKFISFLGALERNRRTAQVSSITLSPSKENRNYLGFTLTLNNYIKP